MLKKELVYKSVILSKSNGEELTVSEGDSVIIALEETGEAVEGFVAKIQAKAIEIKVEGEIGTHKYSYEEDIDDIKLV